MKTIVTPVRDQQEKCYPLKGKPIGNYRWVTAWRLENEEGVDMVQPWFNTKLDDMTRPTKASSTGPSL